MEIIVILIMAIAFVVLIATLIIMSNFFTNQAQDVKDKTCDHLYTEKEYVGYFFVFERFQVRCKQCNEVIDEYLE